MWLPSRYSPLFPPPAAERHAANASLLWDGAGPLDLADPMNCTNGVSWILNVSFASPSTSSPQVFGDCVDTPLKLAGFVVGILSLLLWLVPLFPQLYENYRTKRCEGLSIFFLLFW